MAEALAFIKTPEGFVPTPRFEQAFQEKFVDGAAYWLTVEAERTDKSHNHEFAWLAEAWKTLPDHLATEYPTSESLRKRALIATGYCTVSDYVCSSRAEALRWAANLRREADDYALVVVSQTVVRVYRAMSQSRRAMKGPEFQASKQAILDWVSDLLGVEPGQLLQARAA